MRRRLPLLVMMATAFALLFAGPSGSEPGEAAGAVALGPPSVSEVAVDPTPQVPAAPSQVTQEVQVTRRAPAAHEDTAIAPVDIAAAPPADDVHPLRVRIGGIEVDAPVIDLGLNEDGSLEVPTEFDVTGWYTGRSVPGELGPGVVVGHVDSTKGPAVFFELGSLEAGDLIEVDRSDGLVAWFEVSEVVLVDKDEFPTERVYGDTADPTLRLITCGGSFDEAERSYRGNLIVFAEHLGNYQDHSGATV